MHGVLGQEWDDEVFGKTSLGKDTVFADGGNMHTNNISDFSTCQSCLNKTLWKSPPSGLYSRGRETEDCSSLGIQHYSRFALSIASI